jgi:hypothetical protein
LASRIVFSSIRVPIFFFMSLAPWDEYQLV